MDNLIKDKNQEVKENIIAGIVGAFLFSLAGGVVYFILHLIGYVASISGLIGAVCAVKGYSVFSKKESKKGIIIAAVVSLLTMVLAWYFCLAYDVYDAYKIAFEVGETDFYLTFIESLGLASYFLEDPEIASIYLGNLALGLLFCLLGCGSYVFTKMRNANKKKSEIIQEQLSGLPTEEDIKEEAKPEPEETHIEH